MKFGLFFEISVPRPLTRANEALAVTNTLEQARIADELGFDRVWVVEHHFLEEYSHSSAPELVLSAIAAQTKKIRVCHGAVVCLPKMNHPVRVAERTAMLDILSNGRVELGTARSSTWTELGGFDLDPDMTKAYWDEFVHVIPQMWTRDSFSYEGQTFSMPERNVIPKPYQNPHPPMWVAVTTPGTEIDAARRGMGSLGVSAASFADQEKTVKRYRQAIQSCEPVGKVVTNEVAAMNFLFCHEDRKYASSKGLGMIKTFNHLNTGCLWNREVYPTPSYKSLTNLAPSSNAPANVPNDPSMEKPVPEGITVGDPSDIIKAIKTWEATGVDSVNFLVNCVEKIPQAEVIQSLRLFAKEVMPAFRNKAREAA